MTLIVLVAAVTALLMTILICTAIMGRTPQPCFLAGVHALYVGEYRVEAGSCVGKPENIFLSSSPATATLDQLRACNGHVMRMQDIADALVRQSPIGGSK